MLLANVPFLPDLFLSYQQELTQEKSAFVRSGILSRNAAIEAEFTKGGRTIALPHFSDLTGDSEILSDVIPLTTAQLVGNVQHGVRNLRGKAWTSSDLAAELAGDDPMLAIARRTGEYWVREQQKVLISVLKGIFDGPLLLTHNAGGAGTVLDADAMITGIATLGDAGQELGAVAMHSGAYYALAKKDLIQLPSGVSQIDTRISAQRAEYGTYLGRPVIVDDGLPFSGNQYDVFFFGAGAMVYAECPAKTPVETDRDVLVGTEVLVNRKEFLLHPVGLSWIGVAAGNAPTNTEYATAANWEKVFADNRNVRMVRLQAEIA
jgi:hypothetical protein